MIPQTLRWGLPALAVGTLITELVAIWLFGWGALPVFVVFLPFFMFWKRSRSA
jgi:hypothetical protein